MKNLVELLLSAFFLFFILYFIMYKFFFDWFCYIRNWDKFWCDRTFFCTSKYYKEPKEELACYKKEFSIFEKDFFLYDKNTYKDFYNNKIIKNGKTETTEVYE